jgi:hypothetical protein
MTPDVRPNVFVPHGSLWTPEDRFFPLSLAHSDFVVAATDAEARPAVN